MVVVISVGIAFGLPFDVIFFRAIMAFLLVMLGSLSLFLLALRDRPKEPLSTDQSEEEMSEEE